MDDSNSEVGFSCLTILLLFGIFIFFFVIFIQSTGPIIETGPVEEYPIDLRIKNTFTPH